MRNICVFCGSKVGKDPSFRRTATELGRELVRRELGLVFGGGSIGLMGVVADSVLDEGGSVVGVIPQALIDRELAHPGVKEMHVVQTMHERKSKMTDLSSGFIALPGGFGTADEFFEILTWAQLHIHRKPVGVLNVSGYFDPVFAWLDHAVDEGFIKPSNRDLFFVEEEAAALLDRFGGYVPPEEKFHWRVPRP